MHLSLRQLSYLVAVIDAGSLTRAADRLNVTPTSLSLQMKHLEEAVGARLLLRHSRGVSATEAGSIMCDHAREILGRVSELERFILGGGIAAPRRLRVGAVPAVTRILGIEVIAAAAHSLGGTTLQLSEGWTKDLLEKLAAGALDFVIAYDLAAHDDIEVVTFFEDEFVFICQPDLHPGAAEIDLVDALASDLVFYGQSSVSWRAVTEVAAQHGLTIRGDREVQSIDVWRGMLCRGLGTSIGPFGSIRDEVLRGELGVRRLTGSPIRRPVTMAARLETLEIGRRIGFVDLVSNLMGATRPVFSIDEPAMPDAAADPVP